MLDSGSDGIPGRIGTARLPSSGLERGGSGSQNSLTIAISVVTEKVETVHGNVDSNAVKRLMTNADQLVACFLYFYRMVATIMLRRLGPSVRTGLG